MSDLLAKYYTSAYYEEQRAYSFDTRYPVARLLAKTLHEQLTPARTLDVGCAKGYMVQAFNVLGCDSYGVDISEYAINTATGALRQRLQVCDAENQPLPFKDSTFDLITSIECMEHLKKPLSAIKEMARVVKPGGYVAIASPKITWQRKLFQAIYRNPVLHPSELSLRKWCQLFAQSGFIYQGDFTRQASQEWKSELRQAMIKMALPLPPQILIGRILHKLRMDGFKAKLNIWVWQPEFMLFRKCSYKVEGT